MRPGDRAEIAHRFKVLRWQADLTQRRLAEVIGICRQAVSDIENERTLPNLATWGRFTTLEGKHMAGRTVPSGPWE